MENTDRRGGTARGFRPGAGRGVAYGRLSWVGPLAGVVATSLAAVVYLIASFLGAMPQDVTVAGRGPITLGAVVSSAFAPALGGAVILALLGRFARRPARSFSVLAAVVLALSFVTPLSLSGPPAGMVLALLLMHVVAAAAITGVLVGFAARAPEARSGGTAASAVAGTVQTEIETRRGRA